MLPRLQSGKIYPVTVLWVTCKDCGHTEENDEYGYVLSVQRRMKE